MSRSLLFLICLLSFACTHKSAPIASEPNPEKILFLAYEVTRDSASGKITTKIIYQKTVNGTVKPGSIENAANIAGNWKINVSDIKDFMVESLVIENPLHKKVEYVGEDGKLQRKDIWLNRGEIAVRLNYQKRMTLVSIDEIGDAKSNRVIFSHAIKPTDQ
jgi:hypothetical protein